VALGVFCIALGAQAAGPKSGEGKGAEVKAEKAEARAEKAEARVEAKVEKASAKAEAGTEKAKAERAEAKAERAEAKADKAQARADKAEAREDSRAERAAKAGNEDGEKGRGEKPGHPGMGRGHAHGRSAMRALHQELARGKIDKAELKERLDELRASVGERRKEHRRQLAERYSRELERPNVREELRHHARRSAFLNRALLVAQTELDAKKGAKTVERIEKLIEKENARHERAMQRFETEGGDAKANAPEQPKGTELKTPVKGTEP